jgi:hypothetical protein
MKNINQIVARLNKIQERGSRRITYDLAHQATNTDRLSRQDPLIGSAPLMLPWSAHRMVTGSGTLKRAGAPRLNRKQLNAEINRDVDPLGHIMHRYDPVYGYEPGSVGQRWGVSARRGLEGLASKGAVPSSLVFAGGGALAGLLAGKLIGKEGYAKRLGLIGALLGGGLGWANHRAFGSKVASFWATGSADQLLELVRAAADLSFQERNALEQAVKTMSDAEASRIMGMLGPTLGGAGLGALLVKLIFGGGGKKMLGGALAGALLSNMLTAGGKEDNNVDIYGRRIII